MTAALVTGSADLIGAEASRFFAARGFDVIGIDNDMRRQFFASAANTEWSRRQLERDCPEAVFIFTSTK